MQSTILIILRSLCFRLCYLLSSILFKQFELRLVDAVIEADGRKVEVKEIQARGKFPLKESAELSAWISVTGVHGGKMYPVLCAIEVFQENNSRAYFTQCNFGKIEPYYSMPKWLKIATIFPELMQPPHSKEQKYRVIIRLVDSASPPKINYGHVHSNDSNVLWQNTLNMTYQFDEKGYIEVAKHRDESKVLTLQIAMAVAMVDGSLHENEGRLMQKWIRYTISPLDSEREAEVWKNKFNRILKTTYAEAKSGTLKLNTLVKRLDRIGEKGNKYHAFELYAKIMAADKIAHVKELEVLEDIAEWLHLDAKRIKQIMDGVGPTKPENDHGIAAEKFVGIKEEWSKSQKITYLVKEFSVWSRRLVVIPEGDRRDSAQHRLDLITKLRKVYD